MITDFSIDSQNDWDSNVIEDNIQFLEAESNNEHFNFQGFPVTSNNTISDDSSTDETIFKDTQVGPLTIPTSIAVVNQEILSRLSSIESHNKSLQTEIRNLRRRIATAEYDLDDHNDYIYHLEK